VYKIKIVLSKYIGLRRM